MRIAMIPAALVLGSLGCSRSGDGTATSSARDSAGVRITESSAPAWKTGREWRLSGTPVLSIGTASGDSLYEFADINSVLLQSDGGLVVGNGNPLAIRVYGPDGKFRYPIGRKGQGPGEYESVRELIALTGDSLLVSTNWARRNTVFSADGGAGRVLALAKLPRDIGEAGSNGFAPSPIAAFSDGSLLAMGTVYLGGKSAPGAPATDGLTSDSVEFHVFTPAGEHVRSIGVFDESDRVIAKGVHYVRIATPERTFAAGGDRFYTGNGRSFEIRAYSKDGQLREIIRILTPPVPFTADSLAQRRARRLAAATTPERRLSVETLYAAMIPPNSLPRFQRLVAATDGTVWASEYATVSPSRWYVFAPDNRWLGTIDLPQRFRLMTVKDDMVYGIQRNDDDAESVVSYRIIRP